MKCVIMTPGTLDFFLMPTNDTECVNINTVTLYKKTFVTFNFYES